MCDEWLNNPDAFVMWAINSGWEPDLSLDRINSDGDYEPSNCRWATMKEQGRNRSSNLYFEHNGEKKCMAEWCEEIGIPHSRACQRYARGIKSFDAVFFTGDLREVVNNNQH